MNVAVSLHWTHLFDSEFKVYTEIQESVNQQKYSAISLINKPAVAIKSDFL